MILCPFVEQLSGNEIAHPYFQHDIANIALLRQVYGDRRISICV